MMEIMQLLYCMFSLALLFFAGFVVGIACQEVIGKGGKMSNEHINADTGQPWWNRWLSDAQAVCAAKERGKRQMSNEQSMAEQIRADSAQRGEDRRLIDLQAMEIARLREQVQTLREALRVLSSACLRWIGTASFPVLCRPHAAAHKMALEAIASTEPRP